MLPTAATARLPAMPTCATITMVLRTRLSLAPEAIHRSDRRPIGNALAA